MASIRTLRRLPARRLVFAIGTWTVVLAMLKMSIQLQIRICLNLMPCNKSRFSFRRICESVSWPLQIRQILFNLEHNECVTHSNDARAIIVIIIKILFIQMSTHNYNNKKRQHPQRTSIFRWSHTKVFFYSKFSTHFARALTTCAAVATTNWKNANRRRLKGLETKTEARVNQTVIANK